MRLKGGASDPARDQRPAAAGQCHRGHERHGAAPDQLTWRIASSGTNMPTCGANLTPDQLAALVAFLSQLKGG
jgi:hypothetical protein